MKDFLFGNRNFLRRAKKDHSNKSLGIPILIFSNLLHQNRL